MSVTINLPEKIEHQLREQWGDLPRRTLEALALEGYRSGALSAGQVAEVLQLSVWETESFLHQHGAEFDYTAEDLERDMAESARVLPQ
jgi:predicted HTH domain antitoxin